MPRMELHKRQPNRLRNSTEKVSCFTATEKKEFRNRTEKATPVASAIIADKKVDKGTIIPSGANGKIVKHDVLDALNNPGRLPGKALFSRDLERKK